MYGYYHQNPVSHQASPSHEAIHLYSEDEVPAIRQRPANPPKKSSYPSSSSSYYLDPSSPNGYATSTPECVPRRLNFTSDDSGNVSDLWSEISSPLIQIRDSWRRERKSLYSTTVSESFMDRVRTLLPVIIGVIVLSGAVYSVQITLNGSREGGRVSGKYASILYAHQRVYNSSHPSRRPLGEIRDEFGNVLSGKRAAIQFSYNKINAAVQDPKLDEKTLPAPHVIKEEEESPQSLSELNNDEVDINKKEIVKKVASFGHFASSRKMNVKEIRGVKKEKVFENKSKRSGSDGEKKRKGTEDPPVKKEESSHKLKQSKNEKKVNNLQSKRTSLEPFDLDEIFKSSIQSKEVSNFVEPRQEPQGRSIVDKES